MKGICDACGRFNPVLFAVSTGACVCDTDRLCTEALGPGWELFKVTTEGGHVYQFYAVKGEAVMVYADEWANSVMSRTEFEQLAPLGIAKVESVGST